MTTRLSELNSPVLLPEPINFISDYNTITCDLINDLKVDLLNEFLDCCVRSVICLTFASYVTSVGWF